MAEMAMRDTQPGLLALPLGHLFGSNVTRIAFKRGVFMRNYVFDFAETLSDRLPRALVTKALSHIGWNTLNFTRDTALNANLGPSEYLYFVHSYHVVCDDKFALATSEYGYKFISAVCVDNIYGFQPHPEKSSDAGLKILQNFGRL